MEPGENETPKPQTQTLYHLRSTPARRRRARSARLCDARLASLSSFNTPSRHLESWRYAGSVSRADRESLPTCSTICGLSLAHHRLKNSAGFVRNFDCGRLARGIPLTPRGSKSPRLDAQGYRRYYHHIECRNEILREGAMAWSSISTFGAGRTSRARKFLRQRFGGQRARSYDPCCTVIESVRLLEHRLLLPLVAHVHMVDLEKLWLGQHR
jgi:hypothetical protein